MINTILQITKLDPELLNEIKDSFNDLPETEHADGAYRLRKYSRVIADLKELLKGTKVRALIGNEFRQSEQYNKHQGDVTRTFENIDDPFISSEAMRLLVLAFYNACKLSGEHEFDVHQLRIKCEGGATQISPEGWHQDGYDHIAIIGIDRINIIGGEILLSGSKTDAPFFTAILETGTMVILNDNFLWHNARAIQPIEDSEPAWMDVMVFTLRDRT
ncbi:MAG: agglutination protein [Planctomycetota bacterium]|nr:MAG: agglutination protein [Planctomycetota bacterium]